MRIDLTQRGPVCVAHVHGDFDISTVGDAEDELGRTVTNQDLGLVLDLTGSGFVDSAGVNAIFALGERLADRQLRLALVIPEGGLPARVFEIVDVTPVADVHRTVESAVAGIVDGLGAA